MINQHGDDYPGTLKANFSSNVWHAADHTELYRFLSGVLPSTVRYPEIDADSFREALAGKLAVDTSQISIGNGSTDIIYRIAQAYRGKKSIIISPTFSEYSNACFVNKHTVLSCDRENLSVEIDTFQPDLVWICNPNNPDGYCYDLIELQALFYAYPQVTFILDQSYAEFTLQETPSANAVLEYNNLILIYSMTKRYTIPGLRVGYVIAYKLIISKIEQFKIPWSVNTLAMEAGKYMLQKQDESFDLQSWLAETTRFQQGIELIGIFKCLPSCTPFFLVEILKGKASDLKGYLLSEGILIRDAMNFGYGEQELMRLNTLSKEQNDLLLEKLRIWNQKV